MLVKICFPIRKPLIFKIFSLIFFLLHIFSCSNDSNTKQLDTENQIIREEESSQQNTNIARPLVIGGVEQIPNRFKDENGEPTGIDVEIFKLIASKLGIDNYKIILETSSARLKYNWENDSVYDMLFTYSYKESRAEHLIYAKESHMIISWNFFCLDERKEEFQFNSFSDLQGLRIGATEGYAYNEEFWEAADCRFPQII